MKHKIILEIDGVRHKLIKTRSEHPCETCSLHKACEKVSDVYCTFNFYGTHYRKCKPGE